MEGRSTLSSNNTGSSRLSSASGSISSALRPTDRLGVGRSSRLSSSNTYSGRARGTKQPNRYRNRGGGDDLVEHYLDLDSAFGADSGDSSDNSGGEDGGAGVPLMTRMRKERGDRGGAEGSEDSSRHILNASASSSSDVLVAPRDPNAPSVLRSVASFIIANEFCERLAYYGFAGSLVLFFQTKMGMTNAEADIQYSAWNGACYLTPLLGGYVADKYLGRSKTIISFSLIYLVGLVFVVLCSTPDFAYASPLMFAAIYVVALGTGGIKPNVSTLGADQFDERYEQDRIEKASFFNWFYWSINLGAIISYTVVCYICQYGIPQLGGERWGFFVGYMIPCVAMAIAILVFMWGLPRYKMFPPRGSVLTRAFGLIFEAVSISVQNFITREPQSSFQDIFDHVLVDNGGSYTEKEVGSVRLLLRLLPFLAALIPYSSIYTQMSTAFQNQACQMDLSFGNTGLSIPPSSLNFFDSIAILMLVPVFDRYLYPRIETWTGRRFTMLQKLGCGFTFALLSMLAAALIEMWRYAERAEPATYMESEAARSNISPCHDIYDYNPYEYQKYLAGLGSGSAPQNCYTVNGCAAEPVSYVDQGATFLNITCIACDDIPQMSSLSVLWQIPQFILVGTSEILAYATALEFFYSEAPTSMRSVSQAMNLFTSALGTWVTIPLVVLVNRAPSSPWLPENVDDGRLELYFVLLAVIMAADLAFHVYCANRYEYVDKDYLAFLDAADNENEQPPRQPRGTALGTDSSRDVPAFRSGRSGGGADSKKAKTKTKGGTAYSALHRNGGGGGCDAEEGEDEPAPEADGSYLMDGSEAGAVAAGHVLVSSKSTARSGRRKGGFSSVALNDSHIGIDDDDDLQEIELSTL